jgi:hypothetical protein
MPRILCTGIAVPDQIFRVETFPTYDSKARATEFVTIGGGCAANAAIAAAWLGGRADFVGPLGGPSEHEAAGDVLHGAFGSGTGRRARPVDTLRVGAAAAALKSMRFGGIHRGAAPPGARGAPGGRRVSLGLGLS